MRMSDRKQFQSQNQQMQSIFFTKLNQTDNYVYWHEEVKEFNNKSQSQFQQLFQLTVKTIIKIT